MDKYNNLPLHFIWISVGTFGQKRAHLYDMQVTDTHIGGNIADRREQGNKEDDKGVRDYNEKMQGWFKFVQTEAGWSEMCDFLRKK